VVTFDLWLLSEASFVVVFLVRNGVLNVSYFFPRCGQITVLFRDAVAVVLGGF
jgi:hypothetical protein